MRKLFRYILLGAAATLAFASCDDMLDSTPQSDLTPNSYFRTDGDFQLFTNPLYNNLLDNAPWTWQSDVMIGGNIADIVRGGDARQVNASDSGWRNWTWTQLRRINTCLYYLGKTVDSDGNYFDVNCDDEAVISEYEGLCKFFRTFFYFEKICRYGDVPWIEKELGSADPDVYGARDDREYVFHKMIEDIDIAIAQLPDAVSTYRVNKWTALALKSRICLYEGTYRKYQPTNLSKPTPAAWTNSYETADQLLQMAADAAAQVIDGGKYKLYSTGKPAEDYLNLFAEEDANAGEFILALKFNYALAIFNNSSAFGTMPTQGRPGYSRKFINTYLMADGTRFTDKTGWETMSFVEETAGRDPRLAQTIRTPGYHRIGSTTVEAPDLTCSVTGYQHVKYVMDINANGGDSNRAGRATNDLPQFRYAEVLLNYAEALAELGSLTQADLDKSVNLIRARAGMPSLDMAAANANPDPYLTDPKYGYTNLVAGLAGSNKGVILEIRREREIELVAEGEVRINDLMRWKEGAMLNQDIVGMYFPGAGEYDLTGDGVADLCLYEGAIKPATSAPSVLGIGSDVFLTDGNSGYIDYFARVGQTHVFDQNRDYLYPLPLDDLTLNTSLTQNPNWTSSAASEEETTE